MHLRLCEHQEVWGGRSRLSSSADHLLIVQMDFNGVFGLSVSDSIKCSYAVFDGLMPVTMRRTLQSRKKKKEGKPCVKM